MQIKDWVVYQKTLDFLRLRSRAYKLAFPNFNSNSDAFKDLMQFCRIGKAPYHPNQRMSDILIGRQEVFYRIADHLNLQPDDLYKLYNANQPQQQENKNDN